MPQVQLKILKDSHNQMIYRHDHQAPVALLSRSHHGGPNYQLPSPDLELKVNGLVI